MQRQRRDVYQLKRQTKRKRQANWKPKQRESLGEQEKTESPDRENRTQNESWQGKSRKLMVKVTFSFQRSPKKFIYQCCESIIEVRWPWQSHIYCSIRHFGPKVTNYFFLLSVHQSNWGAPFIFVFGSKQGKCKRNGFAETEKNVCETGALILIFVRNGENVSENRFAYNRKKFQAKHAQVPTAA